jgi:hypothetical protein
LSITFVLSNFPDSAPVSCSRVLRDRRRSESESELMCARGGRGARNALAPTPTTYGDFATTHPLLFTEAGEPLKADHWLRVIESKFGLLHCTKVQKTLRRAAATWRRQRVVGQLLCHLPRGLLGAVD